MFRLKRRHALFRCATGVVVALASAPALSGCASEFPQDYFVVDVTRIRTPVMLSSTRIGHRARSVRDETIMLSDFPVESGTNRGSDKLLRQIRKRDKWVQIEHATFSGHDETSWEYGMPLGRTTGARSLTITGTAFR